MNLKIFSTTILCILYLSLAACPIPLNTEMVDNIHDKIAPEIEIYSPDENNSCANIVRVSGKVTDLTSNGQKGKIKQLSYQILGFNINKEISLEQDGRFQFLFETETLGTRFTLNILAIDWNNNKKEVTLSLHKIENIGIPSFKAEAGNHEIILSWEDVPGTDNYTLIYTTNNTQPWRDEKSKNGTIKENVSSPLILKNLQNGYLHTFLLETTPKNGFPKSKSDYLKAIPLSPQTLTPRVTGEFQRIRVEWNSIVGTNRFEVWRSFDINGPYEQLSNFVEGNLFFETEVEDNKWYYYKIKAEGSIFSQAAGAQTSPFPGTPQFVNTLAFDSPDDYDLQDLAISGSYLYIGDKYGKFYVFDIRNPKSPRLLKTVPMTSACFEIVISGNYAYVACYEAGLQIIDISNPESAYIASSINYESASAYGVAIYDSFAYVADFNGTLKIVDISNPHLPSLEKSINIPGHPFKVAISDSFAYIVSKGYGVHILNLENLAPPEIVNTIKTSKDCYDIVIKENYAFIADGYLGVRVSDIQDPKTAQIDYTIETLDYAFDIKINNNSVYVAENLHGFQIIDITKPMEAFVINSIETNGRANGIAVSDTHAFIAAERTGLQIFNISRPDSPTIRAKLGLNTFSRFLTIHNSKLYVPLEGAYLQIFDLNSPFNEHSIENDEYRSAIHIAFTGPYACITDFYRKFRILDMSQIEQPNQKSILNSTLQLQNPNKICIAGACAIVTDGNGGVHLIDINNPEAAYIIKTISTPTNTLSVDAKGNYAYIVDSEKGIFVIDISNPQAASLEKNIESTKGTIDIIVLGDYAYTINYEKGFQIISLQNPKSPYIVNTIHIEEHPTGLAVSGFYAYVTSGNSGLKIINIKNPEKARIIKTVEGLGHTNSVKVTGSRVFVGNSYYELIVLDFPPIQD